MAWTTPRTWVSGETVSATLMNEHLRDNLNYLYSLHTSQRLYTATGSWANVSTGETDLLSYTVPAGTLSVDGMILDVRLWGTAAASGYTKTVKLYFGATPLSILYSTASTQSWTASAHLIRTGATTQVLQGVSFAFQNGSEMGSNPAFVTPAETLANAIVLKVTGQSSVQSNDVYLKGIIVQVA